MQINRINNNYNTTFKGTTIFSNSARAYISFEFNDDDYYNLMKIMKRGSKTMNDVYVYAVKNESILPKLKTKSNCTLVAKVEDKVFKQKFFQSPLSVIKRAIEYANKSKN